MYINSQKFTTQSFPSLNEFNFDNLSPALSFYYGYHHSYFLLLLARMAINTQFKNKVVIVTGAGTGIGADTAILLAERGAKVVIVGRREGPLREVEKNIQTLGGEVLVQIADVADLDMIEKVVKNTLAKFGALHYAVNNAGVSGENCQITDLPKKVWDETISINISSLFYCMKAQLGAIDKSGGGAIVNVSSVFADRGLPQRAAYSASKHAIRGLTRVAALDWATRNIRVNELQPGVIETPMTNTNPEESAQVATTIAVKRLGKPRECANAIAFLLSDDASYITGTRLVVDGGFLA
jgi:NAD(P)-dependent dehydrogenase (short-subunit alcohol dehydrogenase family)